MIFYTSGGVWYLVKLFRLKGSVFPISWAIALPCGLIAAGIRWLISDGSIPLMESEYSIVNQTQAWAGFSSLVGFLIIFRTSQAYSRFWEGCTSTHTMRAEWFDACSALVAFCEHSKADPALIMTFKHTLVRLFSMLHASALADLEDLNNSGHEDDITAFTYELIDPQGIDAESLETLRTSEARVELLFEWIQLLIVRNIQSGVLSIPPPILSRAFQEIANGMVAFHDSVKISYIPFPFPYAQNCDFLLLLHWCLAPFVFSQWVTEPLWAFLFVFIQVFVLWSLNFIAVEIENPFGNDKNDLDGHHMQNEMNRHLLLLLKPSSMTVPTLSAEAIWNVDPEAETGIHMSDCRDSFLDVWRAASEKAVASIARKENAYHRHRRSSVCSGEASVEPLGSQQSGRMSLATASLRRSQARAPGSQASAARKQPTPSREDSVNSHWIEQMDERQSVNSTSLQGQWETLPKAPWPSLKKNASDGSLREDGALAAAEGDRMSGSSDVMPPSRLASKTGTVDSGTSASPADADNSREADGRPQAGAHEESQEAAAQERGPREGTAMRENDTARRSADASGV